ncbi:hypothetical protein [Sphingomonas sp. PB4P5]|uniref:hypothetical protein n=1 Tax=Parasphingomonas puruogangriensis TaxID=3096155 RepID=UPI002FC774EB
MTDARSSFNGRAAPMPPSMNRSQPQLATAYAPGAMFTWEGGKGACVSVPVDSTPLTFGTGSARLEQILDAMNEYCASWLARGLNIQRAERVHERQLLDDCFYNPTRGGVAGVDIAIDRFTFLKPDRMGYLPGPLVYRCDACEVVREYISAAHQLADPLPTSCRAHNGERDCKWRQLDVVYVHWSGGLEGLSPYRNMLDGNGDPLRIKRCQCGTEDFRLIKQGQHFNRWRFQCTGCNAPREVFQADPFTLELLKPLMDAGEPHQWSEINMIPISYRASPVFYVQSARFIVYDNEADIISILGPNRTEDLIGRVAAIHGFGGGDPSPERIREQLATQGQDMMFSIYQNALQSDPAIAQSMLDAWYAMGAVVRDAQATPALRQQIDDRGGYARRYDPIRSTVEHEALKRRKLDPAGQSADLRVAQADLSAEHGDPAGAAAYSARVSADLVRAGIADMRLIRDLDMIEFSFGFTRVSAVPVTVQKNLPMPVRLMGFPRLQDNRRPVYVIEQQNEAIYVRLDPLAVAEFLRRNGVLSILPPAPKTLGGELIETYNDFGPFLRDFGIRDDASQVRARDIASTLYLLLHTLSHHVMHGIARFSGLDLGSMSEAIFPADLAFLVHRRGMTEDLGNISSMWRDHNAAFLNYLVSRRELRCGSGTLCDHRGGACPACVMVPETACIAGNQLLSRAALVGGQAPLWDADANLLQGYFAIVQELNAGAEGTAS